MSKSPKKIGELYEESPPGWWKLNKAKVALVSGFLLGVWLTNHFDGHAASTPGPPHPSETTRVSTPAPQR